MKTNPDTDLDCLRRFGSLFSQDAPIRAGTTIYFRRTVDGQLITEIGGHQIGAIHSRDLCNVLITFMHNRNRDQPEPVHLHWKIHSIVISSTWPYENNSSYDYDAPIHKYGY